MSSEEYNFRPNTKSSRSKRKRNPIWKLGRSKRTKEFPTVKFTRDGYIDDGFVVDDTNDREYVDREYVDREYVDREYVDREYVDGENLVSASYRSQYFDLDSKPVQEDIIQQLCENQNIPDDVARDIVENAFQETGDHIIQPYIGTKPSDNNWKLGLSKTTIKKFEPEMKRIREIIDEETPTILKIMSANITQDDKKRCVKLFDQLNNIEPFTEEHCKKEEEINNIIRKGKRYTKKEINELEAIETQLRAIAAPPDNLKNRILTLDASEHVKGIIYGQYLEMLEHEVGSQAYNSIREEIEWSVRLPHNKAHTIADLSEMDSSELNSFYTRFLDTMNTELYGLDNVKMQMLHIINDRRRSGDACGRNIALVGAPGTGKTAICKAFSKALGIPFEKISVGGMDDATILKGSDRVWNSSSPSIVLQILSRINSSSGVVLFDELDKLGETPKGREVQYALLHITDYVHNKEFRDNYLNKYTHDFSKILFMFAANKVGGIDSALLSRLDVVRVPAYNDAEKKEILLYYVLPRTLLNVGMNSDDIIIDDRAAEKLVKATRKDPGVRDIEKAVKCLVGKVNMYDSVLLDDGTTGELKLPYKIPNFQLPLYVDTKLLVNLTQEKVRY